MNSTKSSEAIWSGRIGAAKINAEHARKRGIEAAVYYSGLHGTLCPAHRGDTWKKLENWGPVICGQHWLTAAGLTAGFTLAFGPRPSDAGLWTLGPVGHWSLRHWSLQALVGIGSGWCEKPIRSTGSFNIRSDKEFPPFQQ